MRTSRTDYRSIVRSSGFEYSPILSRPYPRARGLTAFAVHPAISPILVLTSATTRDRIFAALEAGADGYLNKDDLDVRLVLAIRDLLSGGMPLSPGAAKLLVEQLSFGRQRTALPFTANRSQASSTRQKHTILFLAANPVGTPRLALDQEARAIHLELERSRFRDRFELVTGWAAEPLDLLRELRKLRPTVVHFSGHGGQDTRGDLLGDLGVRCVDRHGLLFHGTDRSARLVLTAALADTFAAAGESVRLVVLSACYSDVQAEALLAHVDCVVGVSGSMLDDAARAFAMGFYGGLGDRQSVAAAYKQGRAAIGLEGIPGGDRMQLKLRRGVDADQLVLAADVG